MAVTGGSSDPNVEEQLRTHIVELQATLDAIRSGGVDAVLAGQPGVERIYTLTSAERPYKTIVDNMSEGALTVSTRGIILFANRRFTQMIGAGISPVVGVPLATLVQKDAFGILDGLLGVVPGGLARADLELITSHGPEVVSFSATGLELDGVLVRCLIATDLTSQREARVHLEGEVAARTADLQRVNAAMAETNRILRVVRSGDQALIRATDEASLMEAICRTIVENGDYCLAWVGQAEDDEAQSVRPVGAAGETAYLDEIEVSWGPGPRDRAPTGRAIQTKTTQVVADMQSSGQHRPWRTAAAAHGFASVCAFPIHAGTTFNGALTIYARKPGAFDAASVALLGGLAEDLSYGIGHLRDADRLNASLAATIQAVAGASELRDPYTAGHQRRVADLAAAIATLLGLGVWDVEGITTAGTIHDIGKLVIPAEILSKPGRLTPEEFALVKRHAQAGHDIIAGIDFPWPVAEMVLQHHERQDGSGYPFGLMGDDILAGSQIVAVADVVEAMSSHRPYREALGLEAALAEIERGSGLQYSVDAVEACIYLCRRPELHFDPRGSQPFGNFP